MDMIVLFTELPAFLSEGDTIRFTTTDEDENEFVETMTLDSEPYDAGEGYEVTGVSLETGDSVEYLLFDDEVVGVMGYESVEV